VTTFGRTTAPGCVAGRICGHRPLLGGADVLGLDSFFGTPEIGQKV
jgi:hypothetical protein